MGKEKKEELSIEGIEALYQICYFQERFKEFSGTEIVENIHYLYNMGLVDIHSHHLMERCSLLLLTEKGKTFLALAFRALVEKAKQDNAKQGDNK